MDASRALLHARLFAEYPARAARTIAEWDSLNDELKESRTDGAFYAVRCLAHHLSVATQTERVEAVEIARAAYEWLRAQTHALFVGDGAAVVEPLDGFMRDAAAAEVV